MKRKRLEGTMETKECQCDETPWTYGKRGKDGATIILCSYCDMPAEEKGFDHHETCEQREQAENAMRRVDMEIIKCDHCGADTSFERRTETEPHEGERCSICDAWICNNCMDWSKSGEAGIICKKCSNGGQGHAKT